jgi:hypothetical protein
MPLVVTRKLAKTPWWLVPRKVFCSQRHVVLYDSRRAEYSSFGFGIRALVLPNLGLR